MDENTANRLMAVMDNKAKKDRLVLDEQKQKQKTEAERENEKEQARNHWELSLEQIQDSLGRINSRISPGNVSLHFSERSQDVHPAIARPSIKLFEGEKDTGKKIVLNVNAFGKVQAVFLIPHSGKGQDFSIHDVSSDFYDQMFVDFLEQAILSS